jgi:xylulokinase
MNTAAAMIAPGSEDLLILPFGNGSERMLQNKDTGAQFSGLNFSIHGPGHLYRAVQEGIAFSFRYGLEIMKKTGLDPRVIRAGKANMFLSPVFREALASLTGKDILLYNTDGSAGAAIGAGIGCGFYKSEKEAFRNLRIVGETHPDTTKMTLYEESYAKWKNLLGKLVS